MDVTASENLCLGCMRDIGGADVCPICGWRRGEPQRAPYLPQGSDVGGRYVIGRKHASGGDGTTYIAWDLDEELPVYVREFLPDAIAYRDEASLEVTVLSGCEKVFADCRAEFYRLWNKIIKLRGLSSLAPVREIVNDYGTLYAIIENGDTITLEEYLYSLPEKRMTWDSLRPLLLPLLSTVETLHAAGIVHGGISPETIYVAADGRFYIGGFCIVQARCAVADLNAELFSGYAALEQYGLRQKLGAWTDVYGLAAVIYRCLTGQDPIAASQRAIRDDMVIAGDVAEGLPRHVIDALIDAFQTKPENRSVDVQELRAGLLGQQFRKKVYPLSHYSYNDVSYVNQDKKPYIAETEYFHRNASAPTPAPPRAPAKPEARPAVREQDDHSGKRKGILAFVAVLALFAVGVGAYFLLSSAGSSKRADAQTTAAQTQSVYVVPNLIGRTEVSVKSDAGLRTQFNLIYQQDYSLLADAGYVYAQSAAEGAQLAAGADLVVYVSLGPKQLNVPDVIGITADQAKTQLEALGLVVQISERENNGAGTQGYVASVTPDTGTDVKQGETVYLNVWGAPPSTTNAPVSSYYNAGNAATVSESQPAANGNSGGLFGGAQSLPDFFGLFG